MPDSPPGPTYFSIATEPRNSVGGGVRWLVGVVAGFVALFILGSYAYLAGFLAAPADWKLAVGEGPRGGFADSLGLWVSFIPAFFIVLLLFRGLHGRPWARLVSWTGRVRWGHMLRAFALVMVGYTLWSGVDYLLFPDDWSDYRLQTDWGAYGVLLVMTLLLCPIQAASEELLVRGYLNLAVANWLRFLPFAPIAAFALTSVVFAALHAANPEAEGQFWPYMLGMSAFGFAMCALLWLEGGLESAIGYHIANNIFVFSLVGYDDPFLPSSALFSEPEVTVSLSDVAWESLALAVFVLLIVMWNRRASRGGRRAA